MKDPELIALRNKILVIAFISIVFIILVILIAINFSNNYKGEVYDDIVDDKTFTFLQISNDCEMCDSVRQVLDENNIEYKILTMSGKDRRGDVYKVLGIDDINIVAPSLFIIKDGELVAFLNNIDSREELDSFIDNYYGG